MPNVTRRAIRAHIDGKTKPIGALGRIEDLAKAIALHQQTLAPKTGSCRLTIFAGDHGIANAGVSAFPQIVTRQMVENFLSGGAAANVFAASVGADILVVDAGIAGERLMHPNLIDAHIASGTANSVTGPAMTQAQLDTAILTGKHIASSATHDAQCFGEMGIGNTSSASLIASKILGCPVSALVGRGTGLDDAQLARKSELLEQAAARTQRTLGAVDALRDYGGFEIAMISGAMIASAKAQQIVLVDGFIASVAALCACAMDSSTRGGLFFTHRSAEQGHSAVLDALEAEPLLDLNLRLGEGTGALLAWPLVKAAGAMMRDMASFDQAGVAGKT